MLVVVVVVVVTRLTNFVAVLICARQDVLMRTSAPST